MLKLVTTKQFEKDLGRILRRGKDKNKILQVMQKLLDEERLEPIYRDQKTSS
ncbi:hypothetical protein GF312_11615 [Candidatus Poribacteria bacterium]|nr:hypothetical protein [Candidatus Poribacteria bacterium]